MEVKIAKLFHDFYGNLTGVEFWSAFGSGIGGWDGNSPKEEKLYDVELAIEDELIWGVNVVPIREDLSTIKMDDLGKVIIKGKLEIDQFEVCTIEVGNSLIPCEIQNVPVPIISFVQVNAIHIRLYDTNT